jgi:acetolactate synthase-1/2/3 large subunit
MKKAAQLIAERLSSIGCSHAFGIPGGEVLTLIDALASAGIEFVLVKHENNGGFMAEGVWHGSGAPGILVATIGPGLANAVNVIANAAQEQVPMVVLTGCVDPADALTYTHQVFDHQAVLRPLVKASFQAVDGGIGAMLDKAIDLMLSDLPGPVHIDLPVKLAETPQAEPPPPSPRPVRGAVEAEFVIGTVRRRLAEAKRPLLIAGLELLHHNAEPITAELAIKRGIPVITTYKAKGILPEDHELALGGAGLSPKADRILMPLIAQSDLIVLAGYDPIEMRVGWRDPWPDPAKVVEFAAQPRRHGMHRAGLTLQGDIRVAFERLADGLDAGPSWPDGQAAKARQDLIDAFADDGEWGPAAVFALARELAPRDAIATADSGAHRILLSQQWRCYAPRDLRQSSAFCTMGVAVPLAAGSKIAEPHRPVIAFIGDAGLEMGIGELATLRDRGLAVIIVVLVDRSLALIELKQRAQQLASVGVDFPGTDFAAIARAYGGNGLTVRDREGFADAFRQALVSNRFSVIACEIDRRSYDGKL